MSGYPPEQITNEHIIADALRGTLVIINGACRECARLSIKVMRTRRLTSTFSYLGGS
jgi:hypothetical protein